ncbi:MAG: hypothetical protein KDD62_14360, partial [Bdellovibrionales bacterium]|nr:hypothetical protein [Bdellovibrionales bacterium]
MAQYSSDPEQPDPNQQESDDLFGRLTQPEIPVGEAQFSTAHDIRCDKLSQRSARVPELAHELDRINDLKASLMVATRNALVSARSE